MALPAGTAAIIIVAMMAGVFMLAAGRAEGQRVQTDPEVRAAVRHDVSPAVRDLPLADLRKIQTNEAPEVRTIPGYFKNKAMTGMDPAMEKRETSKAFAANIELNFDGVGNVNATAPGDANGSVGATQYVQWVNMSFAIYDKATGKLVKGPVLGKSLWAGFGGLCQSDNSGDVEVNYDKQAQRWVFTQLAISGPYMQCFAVSTTPDATGTYHRYAFVVSDSQLNDYPKLGIWPDGYYMSWNMYGMGAPKACAFDRASMLAGSGAASVCFQRQTSDFSLLPADLDGTTPPAQGEPNYYVELGQDQHSLNLYEFHVDFADTAKSTFTGPTVITTQPWKQIWSIEEADGGDVLDALGDRLMYRLAYRNFGSYESLTAAHTVDRGDGYAGVRWYQIKNPRGKAELAQESTYTDPGKVSVWMPGLAMDKRGNMLLGFSRASMTVDPGVSLTGRLAGDAPSTMETATVAVAGNGVMSPENGGRWGDYTGMAVDPGDDCTLWFTTNYVKSSGQVWATRIVSTKFPGCE
jgi:hypothetical protein